MNESILNSLGLASSAKKLIYGEMLFTMIKEEKIRIVLIAHDMSDKQKSNLVNKCHNHDVTYKILEEIDSETLSQRIGKRNIKAVGITDANFAKLIKQYL